MKGPQHKLVAGHDEQSRNFVPRHDGEHVAGVVGHEYFYGVFVVRLQDGCGHIHPNGHHGLPPHNLPIEISRHPNGDACFDKPFFIRLHVDILG